MANGEIGGPWSSGEVKAFKTIVLTLSVSDPLYIFRLYTGLLVVAVPGGGKTSNVGRSVALGLLRNMPTLGGLILTAKAEETKNWIRYFQLAGREKDLIIFNAENGLFDPIWYEWNRSGRGRKSLEGIVELIDTLASLNKRETGHGEGTFWVRGMELMIRGSLVILDLAGESVSIVNIDKVIKSLPTRIGEHEDLEWRKSSFCAQLIDRIRERAGTVTSDEWNDLNVATEVLFVKWPGLDERPRSSLEMTWSGLTNRYLYSPYNRVLCSAACSFTPEMTMFENKFVLVDWPMLEVSQATGQFLNVCLKLIFQRAWLRRNLEESGNPVLLWQDEFQYFVTDKDNFFAETCRGSRVITVAMSQSILAISEALGEAQPAQKRKVCLVTSVPRYSFKASLKRACMPPTKLGSGGSS